MTAKVCNSLRLNPWPNGVPQRLLSKLQALRERARVPVYSYILLDASFDQNLLAAFPWRQHIEGGLYDDTRLTGLKAVAPHLLGLPDEPEKQLTWLKELVASCSGKPMLSVLSSAIPAQVLITHIRPYLFARTEDSLEWPVRWADTRVLPVLISALTPAERRHLMAPIHAWSCLDRSGEMLEWSGESLPSPVPADFDCWPLDDARFSHLVAEAEADGIIGALYDTQPDLFDMQEAAANHACVKKHLAIASQFGIDGAGARRHFAMLALMLIDEFTEHPAMQAILKGISEGADYATEVASLPAEFWQQTERKN